jgi:ABC-type antimicrobial peptide transport system permease subunit
MVMSTPGVARFAVQGTEYASLGDYPGATLGVLSETPSPVGPTLLEGRSFDSRDSATGLKTAIISESLARTYWPTGSPIDQRINVSLNGAELEQRVVVGVIDNIRYDPLGTTGMSLYAVYLPLPQFVSPYAQFIVRHSGDPEQTQSAIYAAQSRIDPTVPPGNVRTYTSALEQMTLFARTMTRLFAACGAFAILLAITGIYGMSSNAVVLRSHEIGLRRALGASKGNVIAIFLAQGSRQLQLGFVISVLLCAAILAVIRQGFSVGLGTLTLIGIAVVMVVSASVLLSIYLAVRSVVRLEPSAVLRCD